LGEHPKPLEVTYLTVAGNEGSNFTSLDVGGKPQKEIGPNSGHTVGLLDLHI